MAEKSVFESVLRDTLLVYATNGVMLATGILYTFLIANSLGPKDYGIVNYIMSFLITALNLIGMYTVLKITTIFTAKKKSKKLFWFLVKANYLLAGLIILFTLLFPEMLVNYFGKGTPELWVTALLLVALMPGTMIFHSLLIGFKKFKSMLFISIAENIVNLTFAVYFVLILQQGMLGVIYARAVSLFAALALSLIYYRKLKFEEKEFDKGELKEFVVGSVPTNWIREGLNMLLIFFLGMLSAPMLGVYYLVEKFVNYFVKIPIDGLVEVMLPYAAEKHDDLESLNKYTSISLKFFLLFSVIFGVAFIIIGNLFIDVLFPDFRPGPFLFLLFAVLNLFWVLNAFGITLRVLNKTKMLAFALFIEGVGFTFPALILVPVMGIEGLLISLIIGRTLRLAYFLMFQHKVGLHAQLIPRPKDIIYFYNIGTGIIKKRLKKQPPT